MVAFSTPVRTEFSAASKAGIPAVIVPGCVDMANFNGIETVPEAYAGRNLYQWNPNVTLLRTNVAENQKIGAMLAAAANAATAPVAILIPLKGVSMLDSQGDGSGTQKPIELASPPLNRTSERGFP